MKRQNEQGEMWVRRGEIPGDVVRAMGDGLCMDVWNTPANRRRRRRTLVDILYDGVRLSAERMRDLCGARLSRMSRAH